MELVDKKKKVENTQKSLLSHEIINCFDSFFTKTDEVRREISNKKYKANFVMHWISGTSHDPSFFVGIKLWNWQLIMKRRGNYKNLKFAGSRSGLDI